MIRAVLDANVYVSAAVRAEGPPGQILEKFLREPAFDIVLSQAIVDEVLRALSYRKVRKYIRAGFDAELWFEDVVVLSDFVRGEYISAAVEGRAGFVVAGDSDLLAVKEYGGIRIINPRAFLTLLRG